MTHGGPPRRAAVASVALAVAVVATWAAPAAARRALSTALGEADAYLHGASLGMRVVAVDVDRDGLDDLLVQEPSSAVHWFRSPGAWPATWDLVATPATATFRSWTANDQLDLVGPADVDADGRVDLVLVAPAVVRGPSSSHVAGEAHVHLDAASDMGQPWSPPDVVVRGTTARRITGAAVADLEDDGAADLVIRVDEGPTDAIWILRGRPAWPAVVDFATAAPDVRVHGLVGRPDSTPAAGDVTGDGLPELLLVQAQVGMLSGRAAWPSSVDASAGLDVVLPVGHAGPVHLDVALVDGDSVPDLVVSSTGPSSRGLVEIHRGGADLATRAPVAGIVGRDAGDGLRFGAAADVDGDGAPDLLLAAASAKGPRNQTAIQPGEVAIVRGPLPVGTVDLRRTDADLVVYGPITSASSTVPPPATAAGDFDGDGRTDLALGWMRADAPGGRRRAGAVTLHLAPDLVRPPPPPRDVYVDATHGADAWTGASWATAKRTVTSALASVAQAADLVTVHVAAGTYAETLVVGAGIDVLGGYPPGGGARHPWANVTVLAPRAGGRAADLPAAWGAEASSLDGFHVRLASVSGACIQALGGETRLTNMSLSDNRGCDAAIVAADPANDPESRLSIENTSIVTTTATSCGSVRGYGVRATYPLQATHVTVTDSRGVGIDITPNLPGPPSVVDRCVLAGNAGFDLRAQSPSTLVLDSIVLSTLQSFPGAIREDPRFVGPRDVRLSQLASGQAEQSPAVDRSWIPATAACFDSPGLPPCLDAWTTRTDGAGDSGAVDLGAHRLEPPNRLPLFAGVGTALPFGDCAVRVTWDPATDPEGGPVSYRVYRASAPGAHDFSTPLVTTSARELVEDLPWGTTWWYVVRAADERGADDGNDVERAVTVDDRTPASVAFTAVATGCQIAIDWTGADACSGGPRVLEILRSTTPAFASGTTIVVERDAPPSTSDVVPANGFWWYRLTTLDAAGNVGASEAVVVRVTGCTGPVPPPGEAELQVRKTAGGHAIEIVGAEGAVAHRLYRGTLERLRMGAPDHVASVGPDRSPDTLDDVGRCLFVTSTIDDPGAPGGVYWLVSGLDGSGQEGSLGTDSFFRPRAAGSRDCP